MLKFLTFLIVLKFCAKCLWFLAPLLGNLLFFLVFVGFFDIVFRCYINLFDLFCVYSFCDYAFCVYNLFHINLFSYSMINDAKTT